MPATSRAARARPSIVPDLSNDPPCPQAEATRELVAEMRESRLALIAEAGELRKTIDGAVAKIEPAVDAIAGLGDAQSKLCQFLVKNRLKLTAGLLAAAVAVGAISPTAAEGIRTVLVAVGLAQ